MRLLFLSAYLPGRGLHGGSSRTFELLHYLHTRHQVTLLTFKSPFDDVSRLAELERMCERVHVFPTLTRRPFYPFAFEPFVDYRSPDFRQCLRQVLAENRFDLAQLEYVQMGLFLDELDGIPTVLSEPEIGFLALRLSIPYMSNPVRKFKAYYDALQLMKRELDVLSQVDRVICMNQPDADALTGYLPPEQLAVLPHGIDTAYFRPLTEAEEEPFSIGFFGAYHHHPNVDAALHFADDILPLIKEQVPAAHFHIIGIHPPARLEALNRRSDVTVTGFVPDIRAALARCAVVVAPIRLGLGMRVKVLESMALGRPVVGTALACAGLDVHDGDQVIVADEPAAFAESVCYLLQDPSCRRSLGTAARAYVETHHDFHAIGQRLERIYAALPGRA